MKSARLLLGIFGFRMGNSRSLSRAGFRQGSRTKFIGLGFTSPRLGTSTHHSAGSGPLPRRAGLGEVTQEEIQRIIREVPTGSFTSEARKEAVRDGAPPIELVDGEKLASMLEKLELGLRPRQTFEVDSTFFEEYKK